MVPISFVNGQTEYNYDQLQANLISICNDHKLNGRAMVFGFVLWDKTNFEFGRYITEPRYYDALNETLGNYISLFTIYTDDMLERYRIAQKMSFHIVPVEAESARNERAAAQQIMTTYFGEEIRTNFPAVLLFQVDNDAIVDSLLIHVKQRFSDEEFRELLDTLNSGVAALKRIGHGNLRDSRDVFDAMERNIGFTQKWQVIRRRWEAMGNFMDWVLRLAGIGTLMNQFR